MEMASLLNQLDNASHVEMLRMVVAKCTAEQILNSMRKAPLHDVVQRAGEAWRNIMYALIRLNQSIIYKRGLANNGAIFN